MKKFLLWLFFLLPFIGWGQDFTYNGVKYTVISQTDKTCRTKAGDYSTSGSSTLLRSSGNNVSGDLVLPSKVTYNNTEYTLTEIGDYSFRENNITSITIPNSVTSIGESTFRNCTSLISIEIPNSVTSIGASAFSGCTGLASVKISKSVTSIERNTFTDCTSLTSVKIPNSVTSIESSAFWNCISLTSVEIPNSVTSIGNYVFFNCISLTSVVIPNSVISIGLNAFCDCDRLSSVEIPTSVASFGEAVFSRCKKIDSVKINIVDINAYLSESWESQQSVLEQIFEVASPSELEYYSNGYPIKNLYIPMGMTYIWNSSIKDMRNPFYHSTCLESIVFPDGFRVINSFSFAELPNLYSVQFPPSLSSIYLDAFARCPSLYEINIPSSQVILVNGCFRDCTDLEKVVLADGIKGIGPNVFSGCTRLSDINLPQSITSIGDGTFYGCKALTQIVFPENLEKIGANAFSGGVKLNNFRLPKSVVEIGDGAFSGTLDEPNFKLYEGLASVGAEAFANCGIKTISLPSTLAAIGNGAFAGNSFTEVTIPSGMTEITAGAFRDCSNLFSVKFHDGINSIGDYAFANTAIRQMEIPSPVRSIGASAFENSSLVSLSFPETLTSIGQNAFKGTQMVSFEIPDKVTSIGTNAFGDLHYLKMGTGFNDFTTHFCGGTDVLEMVSTTPPALPADRLGFTPKMVLVPEGAGNAYLANNRWKEYNIVAKNANKAVVYLNESGTLATEIRLQTGIMPGAVTNLTVEGAALNEADFAIIRSNMPNCYEIDLTRIPNTSIGAGIFNGKSELLHIALPRNLKEIGDNAFQNCYLATFDIPAGIETIGAGALANCESMDNDFKFTSALKSIGTGAFTGCRNLKGVDLSALSDIQWGESVFADCYGLNAVVLPGKVSAIPSSMFTNSGLQEIYIPSSAKIGSNIFVGCRNLNSVTFEEGRNAVDSKLFYGCIGLETVNLPQTVKTIGQSAFEGCTSLQQIELPQGLTAIGESAFKNSGLYSVSIPAGIGTISADCFRGSSLVYVDMNGTTSVADNAFAECANLLVLNLPSTLQSVAQGSLNSPSLSAINAPIKTPVQTLGNPFADVNNMTCALSIPKPSFTPYLVAEHWGKFVSIRNSIDITEENYDNEGNLIVGNSTACDLTYMDEEDYQDMLEDMEDDEANPASARRKALRVMRVNGLVSTDKGFGRLFNDASLFLEENSQTRFFLGLAADVTSFTVKYNGRDITDTVDRTTNSFVINGLKSTADLVITTHGHNEKASVTNVAVDVLNDDSAPIYNLMGQRVYNPTPGIYIVNGKKVLIK